MNWNSMLHFYNKFLLPLTVFVMISFILIVLLIILSIIIWAAILCYRDFNKKYQADKYSEDELNEIYINYLLGFVILCMLALVQRMGIWDIFLKFFLAELIIWLEIIVIMLILPKKKH